MSDVDLAVVVDVVDASAVRLLQRVWAEGPFGPANVIGADEVAGLVREAQEMYSTNAVVLWGRNPFGEPRLADFAEDLARVAEAV